VLDGDLHLLLRVLAAVVLAYLFGFERQLRGSQVGDRTFSMVGGATAAITAVAYKTSPQAVAGVVTGVGFIGAGIVFQARDGIIKGVTTAAAVFAVAAMGVVCGYGHLVLAAVLGAVLLLILEIQHLPFLRALDAATYSSRFYNDRSPDDHPGEPPPGPGSPSA
jgi:putative Mg2+ transporter-C (MgtC) family protein